MSTIDASGPAAGEAPGSAVRVVCLDDVSENRLLVRLGLRAAGGFEVVSEGAVDDGALVLVARTRPDVVLLDVSDGVRGMALAPQLQAAAPGAHLIALVGVDAEDVHGALVHLGVVGQIAKRTRPTVLGGEIRAMVAMLELVERAVHAVDAVGTELARDPASGRQARLFVDEALQRWGCEELADTVMLLTSELVANAVLHGRSAPEVAVRLRAGNVRIEVHDSDPTIPKRRLVGPDSPSGRGLALVELLSRSWGVEPTVTGKYIWFEVDRPDDVSREAEDERLTG